MRLTWTRGDLHMIVDLEDGHTIPKPMNVINAVRNAANGRRSLENPEDVVYTTPNNGQEHFPFMPTGFPAGEWHLTEVRPKTDPYTAPFFIATDAWQKTERWTLDVDGSYGRPTGFVVPDGCFGIHFSTSFTTLGCLRVIHRADLVWLAEKVQAELKAGRKPLLIVQEAPL